ncbi:Pyruvate dehydrogenase E1 component subunit alpha, somatic form [Phytophthora fragariae]|uniref:Pyruvate dehydrogenase E1 component subunit alpha n=2 Tax=Phytophthora TaxID=4783 RepID=A0A6A3TIG1_9STRA|nr:Pyruvate dehydrogenase E1 component subunit alpha, somatic form [Phytophthora fragariae]KAE9047632.1 Pyruvate dehydrogenase E1 component subunit alpha, somatic form [Phytophthora rubi]KAE8948684.1 Pyruvate dehydrogenase E1 component subunit alpha, somatic form [Phytophthora fragariae]KAE9029203.1 Pyruvate dehydrogenase E1 component subunit alpha, somatic form [Phytophthora fragariae]KAE9052379.1 Pyruvate dehydrogenase E1 component subunit alpha, somatic form [Phytophthora rubi]
MMTIRRSSALARAAAPASRAFSAAANASGEATFEFSSPFELHRLEEGPANHAVTNREEMLSYYKLMYTMRRMEITNDNEYKARNIRGFCHLYDGQEAVATGVEAALERTDSWITSYRNHCIMLARGAQVKDVLAELFGMSAGATGGKGGSMHFYNKKANFYGGQGIVGAQVPVGAGLAFASKYNHKGDGLMPCAITMFGDGASNQGQVYEAANMAALWKLPAIFCIENNHYGMGTSTKRSSYNDEYYTMGNKIPGIKCDGNDVLAVRECTKFLKQWCGEGKGPIFVEMNTYRYHGHSMSDPGVTYRNRDEISQMRASRDPIELVKKRMIEAEFATADEIKELEKKVRAEVVKATKEAKASGKPEEATAFMDVYSDDQDKNEYPPFIRFPDYAKSMYNGKRQ